MVFPTIGGGLLLSWLILTLAVWITSSVLPSFYVRNLAGAFVVAVLFSLLGGFAGTAVFGLLPLGTIEVTWGVGLLIHALVGAIVLQIVSAMTAALEVDNFGWALAGALMISTLGTGAQLLMRSAMS